ncbi:MAG: acetate kinase [Luteolibacter sp.]
MAVASVSDCSSSGENPAILVINCGSSSLKFSLLDGVTEEVLASGLAEELGMPGARYSLKTKEKGKIEHEIPGADHGHALEAMLQEIHGHPIIAVGHRIVHGGEYFSESVLVTDEVVELLREVIPLAPLHNPAHILGIEAARAKFPDLPHIVVFDTAFHQTLPPHAYRYAIPGELYEKHRVRRYGFHGTSHRYVSTEAAGILGKPVEELQLLTAHLGNGSSVCAVKNGKSVDTSMGFTPLEGLVMGTRCGDIDANVHLYLSKRLGMSLEAVTDLFNKKSGLLGVSGLSNDMRTLTEAAKNGHEGAKLAIEIFCYKLAKTLLSLAAALERIDAIVFTGGIGENAVPIRERTLSHLRVLGMRVDPALNSSHGQGEGGRITLPDSSIPALVVGTNEELVIAREAGRFVSSHS